LLFCLSPLNEKHPGRDQKKTKIGFGFGFGFLVDFFEKTFRHDLLAFLVVSLGVRSTKTPLNK
jgi:hypothetical protein